MPRDAKSMRAISRAALTSYDESPERVCSSARGNSPYGTDLITTLAFASARKQGALKGLSMLRWALIFLIFALVAAVLGFSDIAGDAAWIARLLFVVCIVIFLVGVIHALLTGKRLPRP